MATAPVAAVLDNTKVLVQYIDDNANNIQLSIPEKYVAASGMTLVSGATGTYIAKPSYFKPRHYWLNGQGANGKIVRRKLPYNTATKPAVATVGTTVVIDGITFTASGHIGEKVRGAVALK